ncbi:GFA family protein [Salmonella enterica]|nr:GFA family protein [Salmonella enterica]
MSSDVYDSLEGGCTCGAVRYVVTASPLIVHCCHCHWCQRETRSAFVINAVIENMHVHLIKGQVTVIDTPSLSGKGQKIARCPKCQIALWSHYSGSSKLTFLRVGTLDHPEHMPPDVHIYTESKQPWVALPEDAVTHPQFYDPDTVLSSDSLRRFAALETE